MPDIYAVTDSNVYKIAGHSNGHNSSKISVKYCHLNRYVVISNVIKAVFYKVV